MTTATIKASGTVVFDTANHDAKAFDDLIATIDFWASRFAEYSIDDYGDEVVLNLHHVTDLEHFALYFPYTMRGLEDITISVDVVAGYDNDDFVNFTMRNGRLVKV